MTYFLVVLFWENPENYRFAVLADDKDAAIAVARKLLADTGVIDPEEYSDTVCLRAYRLILPDESNPIVYL